jgi:hypothetical protein
MTGNWEESWIWRERETESQKGRKGVTFYFFCWWVASVKGLRVLLWVQKKPVLWKPFVVGKKLGMALDGVKVWILGCVFVLSEILFCCCFFNLLLQVAAASSSAADAAIAGGPSFIRDHKTTTTTTTQMGISTKCSVQVS